MPNLKINATQMNMSLRKSGIDCIGDTFWGRHVCLFYKTQEELVHTLVPYFKVGLENNEFCMWIVSRPLVIQSAEVALRKAVKNLDYFIEKGQMEILDYADWYLKSGEFDLHDLLTRWAEKEKAALIRGFDGVRVSGDATLLQGSDWERCAKYEALVEDAIKTHKIIAVCSYCLNKVSISNILTLGANHHSSLVKQRGRWNNIETAVYRQIKEDLIRAVEI